MKHTCEQMDLSRRNNIGRIISGNKLIPNHGPAIVYIEYVPDMDIWVAHCDEYASIINYCPFCGEKL
jgi:hypothetical protein